MAQKTTGKTKTTKTTKKTTPAASRKSTGSANTKRTRQVQRTTMPDGPRKPLRGATKNAPDRKKKEAYSTDLIDDVKLTVTLLISVICLLSVFGLASNVGDKIAYVLFGLTGFVAYLLPFVLFFMVAFQMANRGSRLAKIKMISLVIFLILVMGLIAGLSSTFSVITSIPDSFTVCGAGHNGGGLIGYATGGSLYKAFGKVGAVAILLILMLIFFLLITGKALFMTIGLLIKEKAASISENVSTFREERAQARIEAMQASEEEYETDPEEDYEEIDEVSELEETPRPKKSVSNIVIGFPKKLKETKQAEPEEIAEEKAPAENEIKEEELTPEIILPKTPDKQEGTPLQPIPRVARPSFLDKKIRTEIDPKPEMQLDEENVIPEEDEYIRDYEPEDSLFDVTDMPETEKLNPMASKALNDLLAANHENQPEAPKTRQKTPSVGGAEDVSAEINEETVDRYVMPPLALLDRPTAANSVSELSLKKTSEKLQQTFNSFGVDVRVTSVICGPSVTRFEVQPAQGVKVSRIVALSDDIKLNLAASNIRIEAPIPGKAAVGIEIPNETKNMVKLRELLEAPEAGREKSKIAFLVGKDIAGKVILANIEKMPHLMIAGATGSGKSVCINTIIMSILFRADPNDVKLIMVDPKVVELNVYNGIPHLLLPVVTDPKKAAGALNWAVSTMMERYQKFAQVGTKNIETYNAKVARGDVDPAVHTKMPQIVIIVDELADLMMVAKAEVENAIMRLAQLARAAGIHLVIATQRPSVNVITGTIKANVPSRIAFAVSSQVDSRTILDIGGAEKLLGNGDMLFHPQGLPQPKRVQGAFVSEEEIARVVDFIKDNNTAFTGKSKDISGEITAVSSASGSVAAAGAGGDNERDLYFGEAGRFVIEKEKASIGMLQRVFKIGFNRAARIMDQLADAGVVGPEIGTKPRKILMTIDEFEEFLNSGQ